MNVVRYLLAITFVSLCGSSASLGSDDSRQEKQAKNQAGAPGAKSGGLAADKANEPALQLKTFHLQHCDPMELRQALSQLLQPGIPGGMATTAVRTAAATTILTNGRPGPHLVVDDRTRTLFVRGTNSDIEKITGLIEALDTEPGKSASGNSSLHVVRLQHCRAEEVMQTLTGLQLGAQVIVLQRSNVLVVPASSPILKDIDAVIATLDVPGNPATKEKPAAGIKPEMKKKP